LGGQLLASCLTVIDAAHQPAYLESTARRNAQMDRSGVRIS
jgi:hypothetical protein